MDRSVRLSVQNNRDIIFTASISRVLLTVSNRCSEQLINGVVKVIPG
jgi:hypothetical protein